MEGVMAYQPDLFGDTQTCPPPFEVHEHCIISGPRANRGITIRHSHEGGSQPHRHPDTGPSSYTIDADDWCRATGLKGGGRKEFSRLPEGEQLPSIPPTYDDTHFEVIGFDPPSIPTGFAGRGGGIDTLARMVLGSRMTPVFRVIPGGGDRKATP